MGQRTPLYDQHLALGAKMVDFGGWDMPLHYGSQVEEHHQVRRDCGVFDVSHMTVVDVSGEQARDYLQRLLANDVACLQSPGKALYSAMLNEQSGVIDDGADRPRISAGRPRISQQLANQASTADRQRIDRKPTVSRARIDAGGSIW